jgi:transposase
MRKADALPLTSEERSQLEAWAKGRTIQARLMERARILLLLAEGAGIRPAAMQLQVGFNTVRRWPIPQNTLDGTVIADTMQKHRHQEWLKFLKQIYRLVAKDKEIHIICDNYATHKTEEVRAWLAAHRHVHVHFTPTSGSWLNMVERLFRDISENRLRRGVFRSVDELEAAIHEYLARHNANPKPFIWKATHADILGKAARAKAAMLSQSVG